MTGMQALRKGVKKGELNAFPFISDYSLG